MARVYAGEVLGLVKPAAGQTAELMVYLQDAAGAPLTGQTFDAAGMAVYVSKPGAADVIWATIVGGAFVTGNWAERGHGKYVIILSGDTAGEANLLDTPGDLAVYVKNTASKGDNFLFRVVPADVARDDQWTDARATNLGRLFDSATGTIQGTPTATAFQAGLVDGLEIKTLTTDEWRGWVIYFLTGALYDHGAVITGNTNEDIPTFTVSPALAAAPTVGDTFMVMRAQLADLATIDGVVDTIAVDVAGLDGDAMTPAAPDAGAIEAAATAALTAFDAATEANVTTVGEAVVAVGIVATAIKVVTDKLATMLEAAGAAWRWTVVALANAPGAGTGLIPVTVTVTDGTDPQAGVLVSLNSTATGAVVAGPLVTDEDGEAVFNRTEGELLTATPTTTPFLSGGSTAFTVGVAATAVTCAMTAAALPEPAPAGYCAVRIFGDYQYGPAGGVVAVQELHSPAEYDADGITIPLVLGAQSKEFGTDGEAAGRATLTVKQGTVVTFKWVSPLGNIKRRKVTVPATSNADLWDIAVTP